TVVLCSVQSFGIAYWLQNQQTGSGSLVRSPGIGFIAMTMLTLATGTTFIMWLGEQITERGVGNGISLIIFAGIVLRLPSATQIIYEKLTSGGTGTALGVIALLIAMTFVMAGVVFVERGFRKVPINTAATDAHAAEGKHGRCYSGHLRVIDSGLPSDRSWFHRNGSNADNWVASVGCEGCR